MGFSCPCSARKEAKPDDSDRFENKKHLYTRAFSPITLASAPFKTALKFVNGALPDLAIDARGATFNKLRELADRRRLDEFETLADI